MVKIEIKRKIYYLNLEILILLKKTYFIAISAFRYPILKLNSFFKVGKSYEEVNIDLDNNKINGLIFMPEAIFDSYLEMSKTLKNKLQEKFNLKFISCSNDLLQCMYKINMSTYWWSKIKFIKNMQIQSGCDKCLKNFKNNINSDYLRLSDFKQKSIYQEIKKIVSSNYEYLINDYCYDGIKVGNFVKYDLSIVFKKSTLNEKLKKNEIDFLRTQIKNNVELISYLNNIKKKFNFQFLFLIDEYSAQSTIGAWCKKNSIKTYLYQYAYSIDNVLEFSNLNLWSLRIDNYKKIWSDWKKIPLSKEVIDNTYKNLISRTRSKAGHVFSKSYEKKHKVKIFQKSKLTAGTKIYGLFTSSDDEQLAASTRFESFNIVGYRKGEDLFVDQNNWIEKTIHYFENINIVSKLIIVIHPRMAKSSQVPIQCSNLEELESKYRNKKFKNVEFVWPDFNISTYNIIELIDGATVSWSSIGIEMSLLGIPVITGLQKEFQITPHFNGIKIAKNEMDYFSFFINEQKVEKKNLIESLRWYNLITYGNSLHDQFNQDSIYPKSVFETIIKNQDLLASNFELYKKNITQEKIKNEEIIIKKNIDQLKKYFSKNTNTSKLSARFDQLRRQYS
jgi:hypothetical protein